MATTTPPVNEDTLITIKITFDDCTKKLKLPLKDLGANILPAKLRHILCIASDQPVVFERFSDSAGGYVVLDPANPAVFKTLMRAAKAKLKLRLRASAPSSTTSGTLDEADPEGPIIARTPIYVPPICRDSTALDQRSVGTGIFEFRDAYESYKKPSDEAPVPSPFDFVASQAPKHSLAVRARSIIDAPKAVWSVVCNVCDKSLDNTHYHCSICDGGDFDLCEDCLNSGKLCPSEGHWLIKRSIQDGRMVSSTTERIAPKSREQPAKSDNDREMPGAFTDDAKTLSDKLDCPTRTCNACVITLPELDFVTCVQCEDYDLCRSCHKEMKHGHHPGHHLKPAVDGIELSLAEEALLPAGRNVRHNAICDGCDKAILGVRHKCFNCPDFDYCSVCFKGARHTHPRHRFAAIYDPIPARRASPVHHHGIFCDGPLCKDRPQQIYIQGVRYKCVVCHDTDFCEACEALPGSFHNRTHPLVKFKTPVNNLTISTESENPNGAVRKLGDRSRGSRQASQFAPAVPAVPAVSKPASNVTIPVRTVADIKPSTQVEEKEVAIPAPIPEPVPITESARSIKGSTAALQAHFVSDRVSDGTVVAPNTRFTQVWTIRNPGPSVWPAGCSVRFVGGDNMFNLDNIHASSVSDIAEATESNVMGREVNPGEQAGFAVLMKAPLREGKYISYWRLKSADGTPFGHRLWCDIDVKEVSKTSDAVAAPAQSVSRGQDLSCFSVASPGAPNNASAGPGSVPSYYALYKERMDVLKSRLDQTKIDKKMTVDATEDNIPVLAETSPETQKPETPPAQPESEERVVESKQDEGEMQGSQMVFPQLDRESPASSTYQSLSGSDFGKSKAEEVRDDSPRSEAPSTVTMAEHEGFEEVSDDLEVLSAMEEGESEDDGFLTDEEYDVLDASDQETVASMK